MTQNHPDRRTVVKAGIALAAVGAASGLIAPARVHATIAKKEAFMAFTLPDLPYAKDALEPHMSAKTFDFHHAKHHLAYVNKLNELVKGSELESLSLEDIIMKVKDDSSKAGIFNNAAQHWNHSFFWLGMKPAGGGKPTGELAAKIDASFGSFEKFVEEFKNAGATQFGSGWAWLVEENGTLKVTKTGNADLPMAHGQKALLTCDVWEHAYYIDYQNRRPDFIATFLDKLVNWEFAAENLKGSGFKIPA